MKVGDITTVEFLGNEKFAIGKVLAGGMGTVYQLIPLRSGGAFAFGLKTLQQVMTHGDFERECRAWLSVAQHENVAHAYAFGYWMDRPAIAMDWYPKAMADTKPEELSDEAIDQLVCGIVAALHFAYEHSGLIHQDIKPDNILIDSRGRAKLADFGLARCLPAARSSRAADAVFPVDETSAPLGGTHFYMAPELFQGELPSVATDLFSFGVSVYQFFTGQHPYFDPHAPRGSSMRLRERELRRALAGRGPQLKRIADTTLRCLSLNPRDRPASYADTGLLPTARKSANSQGASLGVASAAVARSSQFQATGDYGSAEAVLRAPLKSNPRNPILLNALAGLKMRQGKSKTAYRLWADATDVLAEENGCWSGGLYLDPVINLASQLLQTEKHDRAADALLMAKRWADGAHAAGRTLAAQEAWYPEFGWLYLYQGRCVEAAGYLHECLSKKGATPLADLWLFEAAWLGGKVTRYASFLLPRLSKRAEVGAALCGAVVAQHLARSTDAGLGEGERRLAVRDKLPPTECGHRGRVSSFFPVLDHAGCGPQCSSRRPSSRSGVPETLSRLHEELAAAPELDAETAALLRDVLTDIEALLARRDASGHESLARKLAEAAADFEASHPRLTAAVGQLADALGRMGI